MWVTRERKSGAKFMVLQKLSPQFVWVLLEPLTVCVGPFGLSFSSASSIPLSSSFVSLRNHFIPDWLSSAVTAITTKDPMHSRFVWVNNKGRKMTLCTQWGRNRNSSHTSSRTEGKQTEWSAVGQQARHTERKAGQWKGNEIEKKCSEWWAGRLSSAFFTPFLPVSLPLYPLPVIVIQTNGWTSFSLPFHVRKKGESNSKRG